MNICHRIEYVDHLEEGYSKLNKDMEFESITM